MHNFRKYSLFFDYSMCLGFWDEVNLLAAHQGQGRQPLQPLQGSPGAESLGVATT